jgi:protein unc-13 A/B/C
MYRHIFPASSVESLEDLQTTINLIIEISYFNTEILKNVKCANQIVYNCVESCLRSNYKFLFENCYDLYEQNFVLIESFNAAKILISPIKNRNSVSSVNKLRKLSSDSSSSFFDPYFGPSCKNNLDFWFNLIKLIFMNIDEDDSIYKFHINQFPDFVNVEVMSPIIMWNEFTNDLQLALSSYKIMSSNELPIKYNE